MWPGGQFGSGKSSDVWSDPKGNAIYGRSNYAETLSPSYDTVNHFLWSAAQFSGYHLSNVLHDPPDWSWTDEIAGDIDSAYAQGAPDWSVGAFQELVRDLPTPIVCSPPVKLGWVGWQVGQRVVNRDLMAYQERLALLYESGVLDQLSPRPHLNIIEIGCGYGALAFYLRRLLPQANYFVCDLPMSLFYSAVYLTLTGNPEESRFCADHNPELLARPWRGFTFLPHFLFNDLAGMKFDLAINTLSFAEMEPMAVEAYARGLSHLLADSGWLFEQNFDNSHYLLPTFCDPRPILSQKFPFSTTIDTGRWGPARVWSNHGRNLPRKSLVRIGFWHNPEVVEADYRGYSLIRFRQGFYGVARTLGDFDLRKAVSTGQSNARAEGLLHYRSTLDALRSQIDQFHAGRA